MIKKIALVINIFFIFPVYAADCPQASKLLAEAIQANFNLAESENNLRRVIELCPEMAEAHYHLGLSLTQRGKNSEAINALKKAINLKNESNFQLALGNAYILAEDVSSAEKAYNEVLSADSSSVKAMQGLSVVYLKQEKDVEAEEILRRAIQISSEEAELFYNLGLVLEKLKRIDEAFQSYKAATERKSPYPLAEIKVAQFLLLSGKYEDAEKLFRQASLYQPKNVNIWLGIAAVADAKKDYDTALSNIEKVLALDPGLVEAKVNQAVFLIKQGKRSQGLERLIQLKQSNANNFQVLAALGWAYLEDKKLDLAIENIEAALRLNADDAYSYNNLGIVFQLKGESEKAKTAFDKAKELKPKFKEVELNILNAN